MKRELQDRLAAEFPDVLREIVGRGELPRDNRERTTPLGQRGIECGDGWFDIIRAACRELEYKKNLIELESEQREKVYVSQIKEKFGTLTIYAESGLDWVSEISSLAAKCSQEICEACGGPGAKVNVGSAQFPYVKTMCQECKDQRKDRVI